MPRIGSAGVAANVLNNSSRVRKNKNQNIQVNGQKPIKKVFGSKSHSNPSSRRERRKSERRRPRKIAQIVASEVEKEF